MTIKEFANMLDGREYGNEITDAEIQQAKDAGFLVVFGASDDLCELRGAVNDELECYNGGELFHPDIPKPITAVWCGVKYYASWYYETALPYVEFKVMEGNGIYCVGMVIDLGKAKANNPPPPDFVGQTISDLKYYRENNEEKGVVYIPLFIVDKMIDGLEKLKDAEGL